MSRQFEPGRAVEITSPLYGSGYRIGGQLVLTAAHLLATAVGSTCRVRAKQSFGDVEATVVWKAQDWDIALIALPEHVSACAPVVLGQLPKAQAGEKLPFQMYSYPRWGRTQREEGKTAAGGRQIEGTIYLADGSPDGLLVLEAERLPPEATTAQSEWEGASGGAIVCDGLVIAVQSQHQNPQRPASLEAAPLLTVCDDPQWRALLRQHGLRPECEIARLVASSFETVDVRTWLDTQLQRSRARCIARWQGAGVSEGDAIALADDLSIGIPPFNLQSFPGRLMLLTGEIGNGKSLVGDRLFQAAIQQAQEDLNASLPLHFEASQLQNGRSLEQSIEEASRGLCDPATQSTFVVIDEVDEMGFSDAIKLLRDARRLVQCWRQVTIVLISKPIPEFAFSPESVRASLLEREASTALIQRLSRRQYFSPDSLSSPLREAILTPLFAVLLGIYLRENYVSVPESKVQLLSNLVELFLRRLRDNVVRARVLLERLAIVCTDRGGAIVSANEIGSWSEQQQLLDSKLIVEEAGKLRFPLPILTHWFAAQSLMTDRSLVSNLVLDRQRLERWRYPLVIATATFSPNQVTEILPLIAERHPAIAADIVTEALAFQGRVIEMPTQTALEIGQQVRSAMQAWVKGFSPFAQLIPTVQEDGTVPMIGVRFNQKQFAMVEIAWHSGDASLPDVVELPPSPADYQHLFSLGWNHIREFPPYSHTSWAWKWTLEWVVSSLLKSRALPIEPGYLSREAAWFAALFFTHRRPGTVTPVALSELEALLPRIADSRYPANLGHSLRQLRVEVDVARRNKQTHLSLYPAIQSFKATPVSRETLIAYIEAVYLGAFQGYVQLVNLLAPYLPKLPLASILPARLTLAIVPPDLASGSVIWSWYWEPLPSGRQSEVVVRVSDRPLYNSDPEVQSALEKIQSLYPQWVNYFSVNPQQMLPCTQDWLGNYPVTTLAYKWLWTDLKQVSWLTTDLHDSDATYWLPVGQSYSSGWD